MGHNVEAARNWPRAARDGGTGLFLESPVSFRQDPSHSATLMAAGSVEPIYVIPTCVVRRCDGVHLSATGGKRSGVNVAAAGLAAAAEAEVVEELAQHLEDRYVEVRAG